MINNDNNDLYDLNEALKVENLTIKHVSGEWIPCMAEYSFFSGLYTITL